GAAVTPQLDRFIYSTAVEADTPEMRAARALGIERVARPALLAEVVNAGRPGVAIAGTSGKSTITGMVTWLTREARLPATALGGAALVGEGVSGCFLAGPDAAPVAAEACESDGTLTGYAPALGVIHNISRDHGEVDALRPSSRPSPAARGGCSSTPPAPRPSRWGARSARAAMAPPGTPRRGWRSSAWDRTALGECCTRRRGRWRSTFRSPALITSRTRPPPRWSR